MQIMTHYVRRKQIYDWNFDMDYNTVLIEADVMIVTDL